MVKRPSHNLLHFTRKEKNGTIFILFVIIVMIATPFLYSLVFKEKNSDAGEYKNELALLKKKSADSDKKIYSNNDKAGEDKNHFNSYSKKNYYNTETSALFYFDPNTLSKEGWKKLGVSDKTIATIQNYLSKSGRFRQPDDIKKIWGLHEEQVQRMLPFVKIEQAAAPGGNYPSYEKKEYIKKTPANVDVNLADSLAFLLLPGIGPGYARRIIKFRGRLGGFYKPEQVSETFGLPDSTYQKIKDYLKISDGNIKKINLNTATLDELKEHPYIRYQLANAIIQFRTQHGNFSSVNDIKKIMLVTDDVFSKASPYLTVQ